MVQNRKNKSTNSFVKLLKVITSKPFIGAFIFSIGLWAYSSLNQEYKTFLSIPLTVELPENRALENPLPTYITIEAKGTGWQLFNNIFLSSSAKCDINLAGTKIKDNAYEINREQILKNIEVSNVQILNVLPESIYLQTGPVGDYSVPIESMVNIEPRKGFTQVGDVEIKPDLVLISGNDKIVANIQKWTTKNVTFSDAFHTFVAPVDLNDTLMNVLKLNLKTVKAYVNIQQTAEKVFNDVVLKIKGGTLPVSQNLSPNIFTVTIQGGVNLLSTLNSDDFYVYINFSDLMTDSTGIIKPNVKLPANVKLLSIDPPYLYHTRRINSLKELGL